MAYNLCVLIGRLTADPELKTTPNGNFVTSFSIAVDDGYGENKSTDFINIVAWKKTAEFVSKYFKKGSEILVTGRVKTRTYEKDGKKRTITEIVADKVDFCGGKKEESSAAPTYSAPSTNFEELSSEDELPFD